MFSTALHRTLRINHKTALKQLWRTSTCESKQVSSEEYYITSDVEYQQRNIDNIHPQKLHTFQKIWQHLMESEKYKNLSIGKWISQDISNQQSIENNKQIDWASLSTTEAIENLKLFSIELKQQNKQITDDTCKEIVSVLSTMCLKFNDEDLYVLLRCLELWTENCKVRLLNKQAYQLLYEIDRELEQRSKNWSVEKSLMYCGAVCKVFNFHSKFISNRLSNLVYDPASLSPANIVQIMYLLFIYSLPKMHVRQLESYIENYFNEFTIEELGIICTGFFRSQVVITNQTLLCKIMEKTMDNINTICNNDLGALLKIIRYSFIAKKDCLNTSDRLLKTLIQKVPHMSDITLTQLSHLMADSLIYNKHLIDSIVNRFSENMEFKRLKDIERMIFFTTMFNYLKNEPVYCLIIKELRNVKREQEIKRYPKEFTFCLRHLALANIYPLDLISYAMSQKHITLTYGSNPCDLGFEYLFLDQSIRIEVPDYRGPRLDKEVCDILTTKFGAEVMYGFARKAKQEIVHLLNIIFNCENAACLRRILPHFTQTDIILCIDENNNAIPPSTILKQIKSGIKFIPPKLKKNRKWIAIIFGSETLLIRKTNQYTGNLLTKIRQLEKLGYITVVISHVNWKYLNNFHKLTHLERKMSEILNLKQERDF